MRNLARWIVFAAATTLIWLVGGFGYLVLSRLYAALQIPTMMMFALFAASAATALAAISYAARLDEEQDPEAAAMTAQRGIGIPSPRRRPR